MSTKTIRAAVSAAAVAVVLLVGGCAAPVTEAEGGDGATPTVEPTPSSSPTPSEDDSDDSGDSGDDSGDTGDDSGDSGDSGGSDDGGGDEGEHCDREEEILHDWSPLICALPERQATRPASGAAK